MKSFMYLTLLCYITLFTACEDWFGASEASIEILATENITANSAVLVAELTTKDTPLWVAFEYSDGETTIRTNNNAPQPVNSKSIVRVAISGLKPGMNYKITAEATNTKIPLSGSTGYTPYAVAKSKEFITLDPTILKIKSIKSDFTNIDINLEVIPKVPNTKIQLQYQVGGTTITQLSPILSGNSTVEVNFKLENLTKNTDYEIHFKSLNEFATKLDTIYKTAAVSDYDGNTYRIVTIGTQVWLRENFKGTHFLNGDPIPNITDQSQWEAATSPAYCYYNNDIKNADTYGALYNWYVASDSRGLISGFYTPSYEEWRVITDYLGGEMNAGGAMKEVGFDHWIQPNVGATNSSGFTGLPAGCRQSLVFNGKGFKNINDGATFWSSSIFFGMPNVSYVAGLGENSAKIQYAGSYNYCGYSIRLIKN